MAKKDRDYDEILKNLRKMSEVMDQMSGNGRKLKAEAGAAESVLKDRVGTKDTQVIHETADHIMMVTKKGEERIRELERKIQREKDAFESLR